MAQEDDGLTPAAIAANILNDSPKIKAIVAAYVTEDGTYMWYATGGIVRGLGLLAVATLELGNEVTCEEEEASTDA